jgi:molecular chaperone GrpE
MKEKRPIVRDEGNGRESSFQVIDRRGSDASAEEVGGESRLPTVVEQYKARAEEAEQRAREISTAYRRIEEERDAFRERLGRDLERRLDIARAEMMRKVIDVLDDLDRAIEAARASPDPEALLRGIALIRERLFQVLASEGVERIETVGRPFDPGLEEAVATEPVDDPEHHNLVVEEMGRGYTLRGSLLRPARVKVTRATRSPSPEAD